MVVQSYSPLDQISMSSRAFFWKVGVAIQEVSFLFFRDVPAFLFKLFESGTSASNVGYHALSFLAISIRLVQAFFDSGWQLVLINKLLIFSEDVVQDNFSRVLVQKLIDVQIVDELSEGAGAILHDEVSALRLDGLSGGQPSFEKFEVRFQLCLRIFAVPSRWNVVNDSLRSSKRSTATGSGVMIVRHNSCKSSVASSIASSVPTSASLLLRGCR